MNLSDTNEKFLKGREGLTDFELQALISFYQGLERETNPLDSKFEIFRDEIKKRLMVLEQFQFHRNLK